MNKGHILIVILLFSISQKAIGQGANIRENDTIYWIDNFSLTWDRFVFDPDNSKSRLNANDAISHIGIACKGHYEDGLPNFRVQAYFIPRFSYTKDTVSKDLLRHEQGHFDIAEIVSKKLRKEILSLRQEEIEEPDEYYKVIYIYQQKLKMVSDKYDNETSHGLNDKQQVLWNKKIVKGLLGDCSGIEF